MKQKYILIAKLVMILAKIVPNEKVVENLSEEEIQNMIDYFELKVSESE